MNRADVLRLLAGDRKRLKRFGVTRIALFGSFARDAAREDSDVDLLVEFAHPVGLFEFIDLQSHLAALLGRRVDLATVEMLHESMRDTIVGEAIDAS